VRLAALLLPAALIIFLGMNDGGFDPVVLGEAGVVVWWMILLGVLVALLPVGDLPRVAWLTGCLLAGFAIWTGLAITWSESAERTAFELARAATLIGVFALAALLRGPGNLRRVSAGVATGIVFITLMALASRLHPQWFLEDLPIYFETQAGRLNYPLGYWNGLAALIAIGLPLLISFGAAPARPLIRAVSTATIPALGLAIYLTVSRGGLLAALIGIAALVVLNPRRWSLVIPLLIGGLGSFILIAYASGLDQLVNGLQTETAFDQGTKLAVALFVVCALTGLISALLSRLTRGSGTSTIKIERRLFWSGFAGIAVVAVLAAVITGVPGEISERWQEFKQPVTPEAGADRLASASGSGRYQWWASIAEAGTSNPVLGIGPGTFEFWFARGDVEATGYVTEAHSLYLEAFGESGIVGLLLIGGFVLTVVISGARSSVRAWKDREPDSAYAAATASILVFVVAAGIDWAWELSVIAVAFMLLAGALVANSRVPDRVGQTENAPPGVLRTRAAPAALVLMALVALVVVGIPLLSANNVRSSQAAFKEGDFRLALERTRQAEDLMPFAATPALQEAFVLERIGEARSAVRAAREAVDRESTNWANWYVLSRIEAEAGNAAAAEEAYRRARELNPRSSLFDQEPSG